MIFLNYKSSVWKSALEFCFLSKLQIIIRRLWELGIRNRKARQSRCHMCRCCWVGSDFWQLYEWMMSTMLCPQEPCSASGDSCLWLFYGVDPPHIWSSSFLATFYFPKKCILSKIMDSYCQIDYIPTEPE